MNDTYGHQCGDEVIRYVASLLNRGALKHGGIAGRYGGEEFVVAFFEKDLDETYHIVEDIHNQIRSEEVVYEGKHIFSSCQRWCGKLSADLRQSGRTFDKSRLGDVSFQKEWT